MQVFCFHRYPLVSFDYLIIIVTSFYYFIAVVSLNGSFLVIALLHNFICFDFHIKAVYKTKLKAFWLFKQK